MSFEHAYEQHTCQIVTVVSALNRGQIFIIIDDGRLTVAGKDKDGDSNDGGKDDTDPADKLERKDKLER